MQPETKAWLKRLDKLGEQAKSMIVDGATPGNAVLAMAFQSVEGDSFDLKRISEELKFDSSSPFWAQVDLFLFSKGVIEELVA